MRQPRISRTLLRVAFAALVSVSAALLEESFVHTDDGCRVEIHCLACRLAAGTTAVVSPAVLPVAMDTTVPLAARPEVRLREAPPREAKSRAPPLA